MVLAVSFFFGFFYFALFFGAIIFNLGNPLLGLNFPALTFDKIKLLCYAKNLTWLSRCK
jgi:hypothetical protein